jgi:PAS domain S-box-containing protein
MNPICVAQPAGKNGGAKNINRCQHAVQFYEEDEFLTRSVAEFAEAGLRAGEGVVVIATSAHRAAIEEELQRRGAPLAMAKSRGHYAAHDAVETLARIMRDGVLDEEQFRAVIGDALAGAGNGRNGVRAFGEMVALLWADGTRAAAAKLEQLWNELQATRRFSLLCAYPMSGFRSAQDAEEFRGICGAHSIVIPAESFTTKADDGQQRLIAELQQKAIALEAQIAMTRRDEETRRQLAAIVESSDDAIIGKNLNGVITHWNRGAERIFGYTADEIVGRPVTVLIPPERQDEEPMILGRLRRGERVDHFETVRCRKDGERVDISLTISPIKDHTGNVVGASKIARDITIRKRTELQQQALYDLALAVNRAEALSDIYAAALDAICRCQRADRAAILLYDSEGGMRFTAWRGLSDPYRCAVEGHSPWKRAESNPQPVWIDDVSEAPIDQHLRTVITREGIRACAFVPLTYDKRLLGKFMIYYDAPHRFSTTELRPIEVIASQVAFAIKRQEDAAALESLVNERTASLREAVAQMEEFSYTVSHDLRAPLRGMQVYSQALLEDYAEKLDPEGQHCLERIAENAARLDRMVLDVLTFSRVSRSELRIERVSLDKLVRDLVTHYPGMQPPRARIEIEPLADVCGHEPSITQAVSNLVSNAVKFVASGVTPHVRIWTETRDDGVRLWVSDNGIGIAPAHQHRLFRMFERVHPSPRYDGTGVGLAIVRKAVTRMGGEVGVESDGVNGSRFWIRLPKAEAAA